MRIMKLNEWKCGIDIDDASVYVEPTGALKDMVEHFNLKYNPRTECYDCDGDVDLYDYRDDLRKDEQMEFDKAFVTDGKMTIRFGTVKGSFILPGDKDTPYILTSLAGCPKSVGGWFDCGCNKLTALEGCPEKVGCGFECGYNQLTSLAGCPKSVDGGFECDYNQLTSLEGCPENIGGGFNCGHNQLTSLEGSPKNVGGDFYCSHNQLTSLEGCPKTVGGSFYCYNNKVKFTMNDVGDVCDVKKGIYL